jgi:hypothetical protein
MSAEAKNTTIPRGLAGLASPNTVTLCGHQEPDERFGSPPSALGNPVLGKTFRVIL